MSCALCRALKLNNPVRRNLMKARQARTYPPRRWTKLLRNIICVTRSVTTLLSSRPALATSGELLCRAHAQLRAGPQHCVSTARIPMERGLVLLLMVACCPDSGPISTPLHLADDAPSPHEVRLYGAPARMPRRADEPGPRPARRATRTGHGEGPGPMGPSGEGTPAMREPPTARACVREFSWPLGQHGWSSNSELCEATAGQILGDLRPSSGL